MDNLYKMETAIRRISMWMDLGPIKPVYSYSFDESVSTIVDPSSSSITPNDPAVHGFRLPRTIALNEVSADP